MVTKDTFMPYSRHCIRLQSMQNTTSLSGTMINEKSLDFKFCPME